MILKCTVNEELAGKTVKHILKNHLLLSERLVKRLKYDNKILINGIPVHINASTNYGDILEANIYFEEYPDGIIPEDIQIDIIYEDDYIIAVNKHPGIVVHPTSTHPSGTIANALTSHLFKKGIYLKVRPVIRLDRDTSGVIIFAKNQYVQEHLIRQMNAKTFKKEYVGVVHGRPASCGTIDLPIDRKPESIMLRHVSPDGQPSVTHYEVLEFMASASYLKFQLETGRTHQIRVHCQALGHPLWGDTLYSDLPQTNIDRQALHSQKATFSHPVKNETIEISAPLSDDIKSLLEILRK